MRMAMIIAVFGPLLAAAASAAPAGAAPLALSGEQLHCLGGRAHVLRYEVEGAPGEELSLTDVRGAVITVEPAPHHSARCAVGAGHPPAGDRRVCVGANQDGTCAGAKADLPLKDGLECKDCFVGATADLYYKMNYTALQLNSVEVGLRDVHLRTAAALHTAQSRSARQVRGSTVVANATHKLIDTLVACPVCLRVKITVATPSVLDYDLRLHEELEATAGAELDVHLGDQAIRWDHNSGWQHLKNKSSVIAKPVLSASLAGNANLDLALKSSLLLNVDDIIWYRVDLQPSASLKCSAREDQGHAEVCLDGDADFAVSHEADLHWTFLHFKEFHHWGPSQDFAWSKREAVHSCAASGRREEPADVSPALIV